MNGIYMEDLRSAITQHPAWEEWRRKHGINAAHMTKAHARQFIEDNSMTAEELVSQSKDKKITRSHLSFPEEIKVYEFLKQRITVGEDGFCQYTDPTDTDTHMARELQKEIPKLTLSHIGRIRSEMFGKLREAPTYGSITEKRIAQLEERVKFLEQLIERMTDPS